MHVRRQVTRFKLLLVALLLGLGTLYVRYTGVLEVEPILVATATYESALVPEQVPFASVRAIVESERMKSAILAPVALESKSAQGHQFVLTARHPDLQTAKEALSQTAKLLELELKSLATAQLESSRRWVDELSESVGKQRPREAEKSRVPVVSDSTSNLSSADLQAGIRLRQEVKDLETYLRGGVFPPWFDGRAEGRDLRKLDRKVREADDELERHKAIFPNGSEVLKAQRKLLERHKAAREELRRHLARSLLEAHRFELKSLEKEQLLKVQRRLEEESSETKVAASEPGEEPDKTTLFLKSHSAELSQRVKERVQKARLKTIVEPSVTEVRPAGYWLCLACWLGALGCLMRALFLGGKGRPASVPESSRQAEPPSPLLSAVRPPREDALPPSGTMSSEVIFEKIRSVLGPGGSRVLILGAPANQLRSSLTLRVAKGVDAARHQVKLVDFDLQARELTMRLGDDRTPGVGELLSGGGAVEEFFASLPGTGIQFVAAGGQRVLREPIRSETLRQVLEPPRSGFTFIDASFSSPLHLIVGHIDAVLCLTDPGLKWEEQEQQVLLALKDAKLPLWGITKGGTAIYPFT